MTDSQDPLYVLRAARELGDSFRFDERRRQAIGEAAFFEVMGIDPDRIADAREDEQTG